MEFWNAEQVKKTWAELYKKAATDEEFRNLCLQNPREAVKQISGHDLPEGFNLRFVDNAGADLTVVLPDLRQGEELDEQQLEMVAGGEAGHTSMITDWKGCEATAVDGYGASC